jgi:hypothetical protein
LPLHRIESRHRAASIQKIDDLLFQHLDSMGRLNPSPSQHFLHRRFGIQACSPGDIIILIFTCASWYAL